MTKKLNVFPEDMDSPFLRKLLVLALLSPDATEEIL